MHRPWLSGLLEDASCFPPASVPLADAVAEHRERLVSPEADLLGALVVPDTRLADLGPLVSEDAPLAAHVVVTGGAGALDPAVQWARRVPGLDLVALGIVLRDEDDLARNAARVVAMLDHLRSAGDLDDEVPCYVEPPALARTAERPWLAALDEVATADLRLTFRTGGADPDDVPSPAVLARCLDAALDRETPFRCTGGLHHAAPGEVDGETGGSHRHGFLAVLLATRIALDGGDVEPALRETDPLARLDDLGDDLLVSARRWFTGVGTGCPDDAAEDLAGLTA